MVVECDARHGSQLDFVWKVCPATTLQIRQQTSTSHTASKKIKALCVGAMYVWVSGSSARWVKNTVGLIQRVIFPSSVQKLKCFAGWGVCVCVCCNCMQIILNQMKRQIWPRQTRHVQRQPHNSKSVHIYILHTHTRASTANNVLNFTQDNRIRVP